LEYTSANGRRAITTWRKSDLTVGQPRAFLDKFLKDMVRKEKWTHPDIDGLTGERYQGLSELRWKCGKPHRIIGYTVQIPDECRPEGKRHGIFVMLIGCKHDARKYYPTECLDTAADRRKEIKDGKATTNEYQLPLDR
jgi:hypothetical protein